MICDQIVIETRNKNIREQAMIEDWNLAEVRQKEMKHESAAAGEEKISRCEVNKVGAYSYKRFRNKKKKLPTKKCYRCDSPVRQYQTHKRVQSLKSTM